MLDQRVPSEGTNQEKSSEDRDRYKNASIRNSMHKLYRKIKFAGIIIIIKHNQVTLVNTEKSIITKI